MTGQRYRAPLMDATTYRTWRAGADKRGVLALVQATDLAPIRINGDAFYWTCPGCGGTATGTLGDAPVSGWDDPRWVRSGTDDALTLTPSLGCVGWSVGTCEGHWWLRAGWLIPA